jgi:transposase
MEINETRTAKDYTEEERIALIKRTLPPSAVSITQMVRETGISKTSLRTWKEKYLPDAPAMKAGKELSSREKFLVVMETYSMPEINLAEHCRLKGLYVEQVKKWRESCMNANGQEQGISKELRNELQEEKKKNENLEKELNRKDKALAETATLLVLRKKLGAILGDQEEE